MTFKPTKQIRIIPVNQIKIFEKTGDEYKSNADRQALLSVIRHPFRVIRLPKGDYLLLDGTALLMRLKSCGLSHFPVHVCEKEQLVMRPARIKIVGFKENDFQLLDNRIKSKFFIDSTGNSNTLKQGFEYHMVELSFSGGKTYILKFRKNGAGGVGEAIHSLLKKIISSGYYLPAVKEEYISGNTLKNINPAAWMTFQPFELDQLIEISASGNMLPPSIVKVESNQRIYNIDFPISVLKADIPIKEKETFLRDLILCRRQSFRTDVFEGHVFILNR